MPKLNVYNMGEKGINVTKSPIHLDDGELVKAQNWQIDPVGIDGAIRTRDGMSKLNASPMAGAVAGGIGLPLPDLSLLVRTLYLGHDDGASGATSTTFRTSTNGTSWANQTVAAKPQEVAQIGTAIDAKYMPLRWGQLKNKLYYPGKDYTETGAAATPMTLHVWDGTTDYIIAKIQISPSFGFSTERQGICSLVPYSDNEFLVTTYDGADANGRGRVFLVDIRTGKLTQIGRESALTGCPVLAITYQNRIYTCTFVTNTTTGKVYSARPADVTFTQDLVLAAGEGGLSLAIFKGDLYLGTSADHTGGGSSSHVKKRASSSAAWTDVLTNDGTGTANQTAPLIVTADGSTLLVFWNSVSGGAAPILRIRKSTDGSSWTDDYDITANLGTSYVISGMPVIDRNGDIYWPIKKSTHETQVLKRTTAGAWSIVDAAETLTRGIINWIRF